MKRPNFNFSGGEGKAHGLDISLDMVKNAEVNFSQAISSRKLDITHGSVMDLPYASNQFDRIYHTNCYYFWPEPSVAAAELFRVLKPKSLMITALDLKSIQLAKKRSILTGLTDPYDYMKVLETVGFENVSMRNTKGEVHVIFAFAGGKKTKT